GVRLLAQIPLVADICATADNGAPTATNLLEAEATAPNPETEAFSALADVIVEACEERNSNLPPTMKVETH
ncbi:MAG: Mrp/NBP35 family ATP-binding protein, partial [Muribaculaceae bacterium]|nr:Mrp/NBP35 family ATP-binding protein [Muribaculaceae bacterium]